MNVSPAVSLTYEVFIRAVAFMSGLLSMIGAFVRGTGANNALDRKGKPIKPPGLPMRIIAFLLGVALLLVAFGVMK